MSSLPEDVIDEFLQDFKARHAEDKSLIPEGTKAEMVEGVMTLELVYKESEDMNSIATLVNDKDGEWTLKYAMDRPTAEIKTSTQIHTFEPDENGNIIAWLRFDEDESCWEYVDRSVLSAGDLMYRYRFPFDEGIYGINEYYYIPDIQTMESGTRFLAFDLESNGDVVPSEHMDIKIYKNDDSTLLWYALPDYGSFVLWNGAGPFPANETLTGSYPEEVKQSLLNQVTVKDGVLDLPYNRGLEYNVGKAKYSITVDMPSYSRDELEKILSADGWGNVMPYMKNGISAFIREPLSGKYLIEFKYSSPDHIGILEALTANKPVSKDKCRIAIIHEGQVQASNEVGYGTKISVPLDIREGFDVPVGSAFVFRAGKEQLYPGQNITVTRDLDMVISVEKGTEGLSYIECPDSPENVFVVGYTGTDVDVVIPERVEINGKTAEVVQINANAFKDSAVQSVMIPERLFIIETHAFDGSAIQYFTIPRGLGSIDSQAFNGCESLRKISLGYGAEPDIADDSFLGCSKIEEVDFPIPSHNANLVLRWLNPTPEHPITVHFADKSITYTEKPLHP